MRKLLFLASFLAMTLVFNSCKDDDDTLDPKVYEVQIMSPGEGDNFMSGDEIHVHVNFTAVNTDVVHNIGYRVLNKETGEELETYEEHAHMESSGELHGDLTITVSEHTDFVLEVSAWNHDHGGPSVDVANRETDPDITTSSVEFHVHPM
ncbi:MAG: hypothetical protein ACPG49_08570 [Chitinophagales bacterium]